MQSQEGGKEGSNRRSMTSCAQIRIGGSESRSMAGPHAPAARRPCANLLIGCVQELRKMATVGQTCEFLNARLGESDFQLEFVREIEIAQACDLALLTSGLICEMLCMKGCLSVFNICKLCPQFVQLLEKLANSGHFLKKLNELGQVVRVGTGRRLRCLSPRCLPGLLRGTRAFVLLRPA